MFISFRWHLICLVLAEPGVSPPHPSLVGKPRIMIIRGGGVRSTLRLAWPQRTHCLSSDELMFACFALVELPGQSSVSRSLPLPPASTSLRVRRSHISNLSSFINSSSPLPSPPLPHCFQSPRSSLYLRTEDIIFYNS